MRHRSGGPDLSRGEGTFATVDITTADDQDPTVGEERRGVPGTRGTEGRCRAERAADRAPYLRRVERFAVRAATDDQDPAVGQDRRGMATSCVEHRRGDLEGTGSRVPAFSRGEGTFATDIITAGDQDRPILE
jgi:hypothetical protein